LCCAWSPASCWRAPALRGVDWESLEKVMFHVFLPALIFSVLIDGDFVLRESWKLAVVFALSQTALGGRPQRQSEAKTA